MALTWLRRNGTLIALVGLLLAIRIPGISQPYHQDEYKWAIAVAPNSPMAGTIPHPPLCEFVFVFADRLFGNEYLRMLPVLLAAASLVLLFTLVRRRYGALAATVSAFLYTVSFHAVLASLMIDIEGQVFPLLFLVTIHAYDRWNAATTRNGRFGWLFLILATTLVGFLVKLSFVIPAGALALDWMISNRHRVTRNTLMRFGLGAAGLALLAFVLMIVGSVLFPAYSFDLLVRYTGRFVQMSNRNMLQVLVQTLKTVMYASPLLLAPLLLTTRDMARKMRLFWIFVGFTLLFYLVLFDFSVGAIDRYLLLLAMPLSIIAGVTYADVFSDKKCRLRARHYASALFVSVFLLGLQFLPHLVPPQHPKTEWLSRVAHFNWNFLFPFSGGSGPLGFYVSFLLIAFGFLVSAVLIAAIKLHPSWKGVATASLLGIGIAYNAAFVQEYLFGAINGNSAKVLRGALAYVGSHPEVKDVITYNDIGTYELMGMGKYKRRLYADPMFRTGNVRKLNENKGYFLVVNIPRLNPDDIYAAYFNSCESLYSETSRTITATVYNCERAIGVQ